MTSSLQWFQESTSRYREHLEGRLNCNGVCGNKSSKRFSTSALTTPVPTTPSLVTSSPTDGNSTCSDLTTWFKAVFKDGRTKNKTYEWTRIKSTGWRCHSVQGVRKFTLIYVPIEALNLMNLFSC